MSPARRVAQALRRSGQIKDAAAAAQVKLLTAARRDVLRVIGDAVGYRRFHLGEVLRAIDMAIAQYRSQASGEVAPFLVQAVDAGKELMGAVGAPRGLYGVNSNLTQAIINVTSDQVRAIWSELGTGLKVVARRATLGIQDPFQAIQSLQKVFVKARTWRQTEYDAERIIRTEVGRAFSMSGHDELDRAREAGLEPRHWWLANRDSRTREEHTHAWERYRPGGITGPIPAQQRFQVGRVKLLYPGDPNGVGNEKELARMTINCRCNEVPDVGEVTEAVVREVLDLLQEAA